MKKCYLLGIGLILVCVIFTGCASNYLGRVDRSIPISEQSFIAFHSDIKITAIDGKKVNLGVETLRADQGMCYVYIPSGIHTLTMYYENVALYYSGNNTMTEEITTSDGMGVTYDFLPGKEYIIRYGRGEGTINVVIIEGNIPVNNDGVYSNWDMRFMSIGLATTPFGFLDLEMSTQRGYVFDPGISMGIYLDIGVVTGIGYPWVWAAGFYGGGMFETFFTSKFGLAAGGGYRFDAGLFGGETNLTAVYGPYIRGGLKFGRDTLLYGDFYFQELLFKDEYKGYGTHPSYGDVPYPYRNWGVGIKWAL